ncbi:MAG: BMP family ABC transporter substrate-binding protein [Oscillospiraceae bacterium]|nr:BMP family ABC transporter substrate-binding protein [Oscillospiraceae bacterium]
MKKLISLVLCLSMALVFAACGQKAPAESGAATSDPSAAKQLKVVLIGNQKFGDKGPMDDMAAGGERAATDFGVEFKKMESEPAKFEEDIRNMAQDGYDLIITTFPYMSDSTKLVAKEFPDTKFAAVYQSINTADDTVANLWDTLYQGQATLYIDGYMAGLATKTNKVGIIIGGEEPGPNSEGNGYMQGVYDANPNATVEFAYASYEDTAKVKEVALAMIEKGCDFIQGDCGSADSGIMEAINETTDKSVMGFSVICDFTDSCQNFAGSIGMGYGDTVYDAIKGLVEGSFPGGTTGIRDISNNGYFLDWPTYEAFAQRNAEYGEAFTAAIEKGKELETKVKNGELTIPYVTDVPNWSVYSGK